MLGKGLESLIPPLRQDSEGHAPQEPTGEAESERRVHTSKEENIDQAPLRSSPPAGRQGSEGQAPNQSEHGSGQAEEGPIFQIEIEKIRPNPQQPRKYFDEGTLRELAVSIREFGIIQPLVASKIEGESEQGWSVYYELISGERRLMAAGIAGLVTVPVIIRSGYTDREKLELAVIENIQRADLNPIELARAIARLQDEFGLTQREIAARLGKGRGTIANTVRLLGLPTEIQDAIATERISESHARLLLSVDDVALREKVFRDILNENLNVRETEMRVKRSSKDNLNKGAENIAALENPEVAYLRDKLEEFLGTKVDLESRGSRGKITIRFYSPEELAAIVEKVTKQSGNQSPLPPLDS